jgi:hypothetical protein
LLVAWLALRALAIAVAELFLPALGAAGRAVLLAALLLAVGLGSGLEAAALAVAVLTEIAVRRGRTVGSSLDGGDYLAVGAGFALSCGSGACFSAFIFTLAAAAAAALRLSHPMRDSLSVFI